MLYYLNQIERTELKSVRASTFANIGWIEKDLENLISTNITKLIPENQLMVLFQERPFEEAADIYALDKKGDLYIFELKRWISNPENILGPVTIWGTDILSPKNSNTDETRSRFTRLTLRDCVPDRILHNKFKMSGFDMRFFTTLSCVNTSF